MKAFTNANPRDLPQALTIVREAQQAGRTAVVAGGGSDLLGLMKERLVAPDDVDHSRIERHGKRLQFMQRPFVGLIVLAPSDEDGDLRQI